LSSVAPLREALVLAAPLVAEEEVVVEAVEELQTRLEQCLLILLAVPVLPVLSPLPVSVPANPALADKSQ